MATLSNVPFEDIEQKYKEIIENIEIDDHHYNESAKERYDTANDDYHNSREIIKTDRAGTPIKLQRVNDEKTFIKRYSGLMAGSEKILTIIPKTEQDQEKVNKAKFYLEDYIEDSNFKDKTRKLANKFKRLGNTYLATYFEPTLYNQKYSTVGTIIQELVPFYEMRLDANSRNTLDPNSPYYRNRQFRIRALPIKDVKKIARAYNKDEEFIERIGEYSDGKLEIDKNNSNSESDQDSRAIIVDYEFRELIQAEHGVVWAFFQCSIINADSDLILKEIEPSPINRYMTEVASMDDRDDTPYASGYMEDTKEERELEAEAITAELIAAKSGVKATIIKTKLTQAEIDENAKHIGNPKKIIKLNPEDSIHEPKNRGFDETYESILRRLKDRKQNKGGEFDLQAGKRVDTADTGKLVNALNSRSDLAKEEDRATLERVLTNSIKTYYELSVLHYDMEVIVTRLSKDGSDEKTEFETIKPTTLRDIDFDMSLKIDLNSDVIKAQKQALAQSVGDILSPVDRLKLMGADKPELLYSNFLNYQGLLEVAEWLKADPNNSETLKTLMAEQSKDQEIAELIKQQST